jgi:O-methyltransferase
MRKTIFIMQNRDEQDCLYKYAKRALRTEGDFAEVGVYQGGSAEVICRIKGDRPLHLFDTFEGLPPLGVYDTNIIDHHDYKASEEGVREFLNYPNVIFHKGLFPNFSGSIEDTRFCFVHIDVDLYQSTIDALKFFYPRVNSGGVILGHDYPITEGVAKAFHEFFSDKPELIEYANPRQGVVIKR